MSADHSRITRRLNNEKEHAVDGALWTTFDDKNRKYLYVPINLYGTLQTRAEKVGRDPALIFTFDTLYPFRSPDIKYYNVDIKQIYRCSPIFVKDMESVSDIGCICCGSILCSNNWRVNYGVQSVINEFLKITTWKARVVERLMCKKVQKQLIARLPVEDYPIFEYYFVDFFFFLSQRLFLDSNSYLFYWRMLYDASLHFYFEPFTYYHS